MKRDFLREQGLSDEQVNAIMTEHGKTLNTLKDEVTSKTNELTTAKEQLTQRDTQLTELGEKAKGNEALTTQINELTEANKQAKADYDTQLHQQAFDHKLDGALVGAKVKSNKSLIPHLDMDKIKLDGETLLGLDDQLKAIKESDGYLFGSDEPTPDNDNPQFSQGQHQKSPEKKSFGEMLGL